MVEAAAGDFLSGVVFGVALPGELAEPFLIGEAHGVLALGFSFFFTASLENLEPLFADAFGLGPIS